jgi:hypothetical protein
VGPGADLEKRKFLTLPGFEHRSLGRLAHRQSLYRLRYPGSVVSCGAFWKHSVCLITDNIMDLLEGNSKFWLWVLFL